MADAGAPAPAVGAAAPKLAVVTGANKGIGYYIAQQLRDAGVRVVIACRNEEHARAAAASLGIEYELVDLAGSASIANFAAVMAEKYGYLDVLVNNAAIAFKGRDPTPFAQQTEPTLRTNFWGTVQLTDALLHLLRASAARGRQPRLVNVASVGGKLAQVQGHLQERFASPTLDRAGLMELVQKFERDVSRGAHRLEGWGGSNYGLSKLALIAYTRIIAREEGATMRVNSCCPGWCATDMSSHSGPRLASVGARTATLLALLPDEGPTGAFFRDEAESTW